MVRLASTGWGRRGVSLLSLGWWMLLLIFFYLGPMDIIQVIIRINRHQLNAILRLIVLFLLLLLLLLCFLFVCLFFCCCLTLDSNKLSLFFSLFSVTFLEQNR